MNLYKIKSFWIPHIPYRSFLILLTESRYLWRDYEELLGRSLRRRTGSASGEDF